MVEFLFFHIKFSLSILPGTENSNIFGFFDPPVKGESSSSGNNNNNGPNNNPNSTPVGDGDSSNRKRKRSPDVEVVTSRKRGNIRADLAGVALEYCKRMTKEDAKVLVDNMEYLTFRSNLKELKDMNLEDVRPFFSKGQKDVLNAFRSERGICSYQFSRIKVGSHFMTNDAFFNGISGFLNDVRNK